ncbi:putative uncharacterized protein DDB_G0286901 isoform X7 [Musca domestica]|uniref:BZIP domain-containing protein n=1 Tax=Musca domestica TaxID=7370 RepID=A0ABM3VL68_MUSDO|nr:putative uncharacterized protein DDB_G0286901 isoform X7 [Musca domestica]
MRDLSMRMDYQLPPQSLQLGSLMNGPLAAAAAAQHNGAQLQILQLNQHHHNQQQLQQQQQHQQQNINNQQQQHLLNHMNNNVNNNSGNNNSSNNGSTQPLPSLSSLPLQVMHNLPHLLAGSNAGGIAGGGGGGNLSSSPSSNGSSLNLLNNNLNLSPNNNNSNTLNANNTHPTNNHSNNNVATHTLLRNTMQHVANANQQLQQTINNLSNNLVSSLPPSSQLLQHHLQHLANVNNAVVQLNGNNSSSNSSSPLSNGSNNSGINNMLLNNSGNNNNNSNSNNSNTASTTTNNNNNSSNNNLAQHLSDNVVAHNLVNGLVGVLSNVQNQNGNLANNSNTVNNINNNNNNNTNNVNANNNNNNNNNPNTPNLEDNNRWTQFQVQQLWKQHASYLNGKSTSNSKEVICPDDKYKEEGDLWNVEAQTAFLGPNLWEKTLPYDADLKVTQYADLDEFLSENNIPDGLPGTHLGHSSSLGHRSDSLSHAAGLSLGLGHITTKRERSPSPSDCISPDTLNPPSPAESTFSFASSGRDFDPRTRAFSDEELKPQPMIKKSRKQFVPDELKDDKYWARRRKNNIAAKRSRDARRQKENQIAMRARYLEKENATLHQEVEQLKQENMDLRARLSKFQDV